MMTSSSPCFFHSSRMYSASSLLRFDPATWGSAVKMRCWRRSSSGVGMDLYLASTFASRAEEAGVKPRIGVWAWATGNSEKKDIKAKGTANLPMFIDLPQGVLPSQVAASRRHDSRRDGGATSLCFQDVGQQVWF